LRRSAPIFPIEIIVVDGQSHDKTLSLAQQAGARVFVAPAPGRALQMHLGAQKAQGEILLFLHVDTALPPTWQSSLAEAFLSKNADPDRPVPAAIAFRLSFDLDTWPYRLIARMAHLRGRITGIPQGDQALSLTRETYFSAGGFPPVPLMEEYLFVPRVRKLGRVDVLPEKVVTSCRRYQNRGPFRTALRHSLLVALFYLGVSPERLARYHNSSLSVLSTHR
jgi:rSAM/selenodomain-associated transferase 2